jgi:NTE family protein
MIDGCRIGLALGGGAARGLAHIGVLKVLEQQRIPIDLIAGTSIGALVGGVYATTRSAEATERRFREFIFSEEFKRARFDFLRESREASPQLLSSVMSLIKRGIFYSVSMAKSSFVSAEHFEHNINSILDDIQIEQTVIPFAAIAADINRGEQVVLKSGSLRRAVSASSAVPGLLPPVSIDGRTLIDGGWVAKVPVVPALLMGADLVIGVDVSREIEEQVNLRSGLNIMVRANSISTDALKSLQCRLADTVIVPDVGRIHWADFSAVHDCVARGEEAARAGLADIRRQHRAARWASFLGISRARRLARYYRGASRFRGVE